MRSLSSAFGALDRDLHVVEPGRLQRFRALGSEQGPGGDERRVETGVARARAELVQVAAEHRLAARERELQDAEPARLVEGANPVLGLQLGAVLLAADVERVRAVRAVQRALVGQLGDQRGRPRCCIDHESSLGHALDQPLDVVAQVGALVALREGVDDVVEGALPVAQLEHLRRGVVEPHRTLGDQEQVLLAHLVVAKPRAGGETGTSHASCPGGWVSPRSMASSWAHSISVLKRRAATAASCCAGVAAALDHEIERVLRVPGRLHQSRAEVLEARGVDPGVMGLQRLEPDPDRGRPEELGEGRGHRLDPRLLAGEAHVGVDRVAHRREHAALRLQCLPRDAERLAEPQPGLDAARPGGRAVVVDDAPDPLPPDLDLGAVRQDRRVLQRNAPLVVEPVGHPALKLLAGELSRVHSPVEGVQVVVARPLRAQLGDELLGRPRLALTGPCRRAGGHSSISRPS